MTTPSKLNEFDHAEDPARRLLERLGWTYVPRAVLAGEREDERGVLLTGRLSAALLRLNEWMTEDQAQRVIFNLQHVDATGLARNQRIHEYLVYGMPLTIDRGGGQETPSVRFFDFDHPEPDAGLNEYVVTTQFRVRRGNERGSARTSEDDERAVIPDLVLFVNGIPLVVIEAKSPSLLEVWKTKAVRQLLRYQEAGPEWHGAGAPELFDTNLMCVALCGADAAYAAIGAPENAYAQWKLIDPVTEAEFERRFGTPAEGQARLIAGLLSPPVLLNILRDFVVFEPGARASGEEAAALPAVPRCPPRPRAHPGWPHACGARRCCLAHAGIGQVADDAVAGDEATPLAFDAKSDDRRRHGPQAAGRPDQAHLRAHGLPKPGGRAQHRQPARAAGHKPRRHGDDDDPEIR